MSINISSPSRSTVANLRLAICIAVLCLSALLGAMASPILLALIAAGVGLLMLLQQPVLGLMLLAVSAVAVPLQFSTGTAVVLNPVTMLVPVVFVLWILAAARGEGLRLAPSHTNRPLILFLIAGLLALVIGTAIWDPAVPRSGRFLLVQLAQWAIFAFSAMAYWLMGNLARDETWLKRVTFSFMCVAGCLAILFVIPGVGVDVARATTAAMFRAPFWMLLTGIALGQLLFNKGLSAILRIFFVLVLAAVLAFALYWNQETSSTWVGIATVVCILVWLRWPRLRWPVVILLVLLASTGVLVSGIYDFAGGDQEWQTSGGSRLVLIGRVLEVTLHNPITGLGPAAYRAYSAVEPLAYYGALWVNPQISSHNNYVDLFSHVGLVGIGILAWFAIEVVRLGFRLRAHFTDGFAAGYVNSMLAIGGGALTLMLFADWILPYVYNIGFPGFQASVLVWLFMGGLVTLEQRLKADLAQ